MALMYYYEHNYGTHGSANQFLSLCYNSFSLHSNVHVHIFAFRMYMLIDKKNL